MKNKRGVFFSTDALIALIIIFMSLLVVYPVVNHSDNEKFIQQDILEVMSNLTIGEARDDPEFPTISYPCELNNNKTFLKQIGEFYASGDENIKDCAKQLAEYILKDVNESENIGIWYGGLLPLANKNKTSWENAKNIDVERQAISGIKAGESATGFSSRAYLKNTYQTKYFYFGGYVGDGNISIMVDYQGNLSDIDLEITANKAFDMYIKKSGASEYIMSGHYEKSQNDFTPQNYVLGDGYSGNFAPGLNIVKFVGNDPNPEADKRLHISGGFIKIIYNNSNEEVASQTTKRYYFPGIEGLINIYDSFYFPVYTPPVPDDLRNMKVHLHYNTDYNMSLNIGGKEVFLGNNTVGGTDTIVDIPVSTLINKGLSSSDLSGKTVPVKLGLKAFQGEGGGAVDIVFLVDSTSSMLPYIQMVNKTLNSFANNLSNAGVDFRLGLVEFKDYPTYPEGTDFPFKIHNFSGEEFTTDVAKFKEGLRTILDWGVWGGSDLPESHLTAIDKAVDELDYLEGRKKIFILLSDNKPHAKDCLEYGPDNIYMCNLSISEGEGSCFSNNYLRITTDPLGQNSPSISGDKVVWVDYRNSNPYLNPDIYMWDPVNGERQITTGSDYQYSPSISGDKIVWFDSSWTDPGIHMCNLSISSGEGSCFSNNYLRITTDSSSQSPSISGDKIVWEEGPWGSRDIYVWDPVNGERQITTDPSDQSYPSISGNKIVWLDQRNGNYEIYMCDLSISSGEGSCFSNDERRIISEPYEMSISISNDKIAWVDYRNGNNDIYMCNLSISSGDGSCFFDNQIQITSDPSDQYYPSISNDKIAWIDYRNKDYSPIPDIYMWDPVNGERRVIPSDSINCFNRNIVSISGDKIVWGSNENNGIDTYEDYYLGPETVAEVIQKLVNNDVTFFYINRKCGLCMGRNMADGMTSATGGKFYRFTSADDVDEIINDIGKDIIEISYSGQTISGNVNTKLYNDSYIEFSVSPEGPPYALVISAEKKFSDSSTGSFSIPAGSNLSEANVISYSGPRWTDTCEIKNETSEYKKFYNLSSYGSIYVDLGDPYSIKIPNNKISAPGSLNILSLTTATGIEGRGLEGSSSNKIIYKILKNVVAFSDIKSSAEGCIWTIAFEDSAPLIMKIPPDYSGSKVCEYTAEHHGTDYYDTNSAVQQSTYSLLEQLDFDDPKNGKIDAKFSEDSMAVETSQITGIPWDWEIEVNVRRWS